MLHLADGFIIDVSRESMAGRSRALEPVAVILRADCPDTGQLLLRQGAFASHSVALRHGRLHCGEILNIVSALHHRGCYPVLNNEDRLLGAVLSKSPGSGTGIRILGCAGGCSYAVQRCMFRLLQVPRTGVASIILRSLLPKVGGKHESIKIELAHIPSYPTPPRRFSRTSASRSARG